LSLFLSFFQVTIKINRQKLSGAFKRNNPEIAANKRMRQFEKSLEMTEHPIKTKPTSAELNRCFSFVKF